MLALDFILIELHSTTLKKKIVFITTTKHYATQIINPFLIQGSQPITLKG